MGIRALVRELRARPLRPAADLRAAHLPRGVRRRARWSRWPRPGCRPGGPAGSRRSRRCATTSRCPESSLRRRLAARPRAHRASGVAAGAGRALRRDRAAQRLVGRRRRPRDPARRRRGEPGDQPAVPGAGAGAAYAAAVRHRRQPRRPELAAQPAAYDGHRLGADDRAGPGLHDGDRRRLGQGAASTSRSRRTSSATSSSAT